MNVFKTHLTMTFLCSKAFGILFPWMTPSLFTWYITSSKECLVLFCSHVTVQKRSCLQLPTDDTPRPTSAFAHHSGKAV